MNSFRNFSVKIFSLIIVLSLIVISSNTIYAEENSLDKLRERTESLREKAASKAAERLEKKEAIIEKIQTKRDAVREKIESKREDIQSKLAALKDKRASKSAAIKEKLTEKKKEIVKKHSDKMLARIEAAVTRFNNIQGRIENRIAKLKEEGKDVASLEESLAQAKLKGQATKDAISTAKTSLAALQTETEPSEIFKIAREAIDNVKEALKDWHRALQSIVSEIEKASSE